MGAGVKRVMLGIVAVLAGAVVTGVPAAPAQAQVQSPWWHLSTGARPTVLAPAGDGELVVTAENVGDAKIDGAGPAGPAVITDTLPPGLRATGVAGAEPSDGGFSGPRAAVPCALVRQSRVTCELPGTLVPYATVEIRVAVSVEGAASGASNEVNVSGGGAPAARAAHPLTIGGQPNAFGVESYELSNEALGGGADAQAGSHPFQQTTTIALNQTADLASLSQQPLVRPVALPKDLSFRWPAGMIGNATRIPQCTTTQFYTTNPESAENGCPPQTAVGVISLAVYEPANAGFATFTLPVFNLEPASGEPARFGFFAKEGNAPGFIDTSVRTGGDYGVTVSIDNITQTAAFFSSRVTLWGTPGDPRHDKQRGWGCLLEARGEEHASACTPSGEARPPSLLTLGSTCPLDPATLAPKPLLAGVEGDAWNQQEPRSLAPLAQASLPGLSGCAALPFDPQIAIGTEVSEASRPTGLSLDVHVPQQGGEAEGIATSDLEGLRVTLPEGLTVNPAVADGLQACSEAQVGLANAGAPACPDASKLGTATIASPLALAPLQGSVYLATPQANPFGSLLALYAIGEDPTSGVRVKLAGEVTLDRQSGRVTVSFQHAPQLPLENIELSFLGGARTLLSTPPRCGSYTATAALTPWSGDPPAEPSASFAIASGPGGSACPSSALAFTPSLEGGTTNNGAGAFSPLTATISREDGQQALRGFTLHLPPGLAGMLSAVPLCAEAQANAGTCPAASLIGQTTVSAGVGSDPYTLAGGKVYLTGPTLPEGPNQSGAPFGLSIVTPVKAGPLDLENTPENHPACDCLVIRAKLEVNPTTAALSIVSDASTGGIPTILDGLPLQVRHLNFTIDRPAFIFNSTDCDPLSMTGTIAGGEGGSAPVSSPYHVGGCGKLKFKPRLTARTRANGELSGHGASLHVVVTTPQGRASGPTQGSAAGGAQGAASGGANIKALKLDLPQRLPARLETIQHACPQRTFDANPAACPKGSVIGSASVQTPILGTAMVGPAYLVAKGGTDRSHRPTPNPTLRLGRENSASLGRYPSAAHTAATRKGEAAFPDIVLVLQGDGVRIDLTGALYVDEHNITSVTFRAIPDVPIRRFDLVLPEGPRSVLAAGGRLCGRALRMQTAIDGQNGAVVKPQVVVGVDGCRKGKGGTKKRRQRPRAPVLMGPKLVHSSTFEPARK